METLDAGDVRRYAVPIGPRCSFGAALQRTPPALVRLLLFLENPKHLKPLRRVPVPAGGGSSTF
jgi:hypothetical protein